MKELIGKDIVMPSGAELIEAPLSHRGQVGLKYNLGSYMNIHKKRAKQRNPVAANQANIGNWIFYDRLSIAAGVTTATEYTMFTTPIGGTKTKADTNLESVGKLQSPRIFNTFSIGFLFMPNVLLADLQAILAAYYIEFWVSDRIYIEGPVYDFPAGGGVYGSTTGTSGNGWPVIGNEYDLRLPAGMNLGSFVTDGLTGIMILQDESFKVSVKSAAGVALTAGGGGGTGWNMMCQLKGILSRAVN